MEHDGLYCNFRSILEGEEIDESAIKHRLEAFCQDLQSRLVAAIDIQVSQYKENERKHNAIINEQKPQLHKDYKDKESQLETILLQQKLTEKKVAAAAMRKTEILDDIEKNKMLKESITLGIADLELEFEKTQKEKKDKWNAIKRACTFYKDNLDIHLALTLFESYDEIKVTFFQRLNPDRDNYYVILQNSTNGWKVGRIEPVLKDNHLERIKATIDLTNSLDILDVMALLCMLRDTFKKYIS